MKSKRVWREAREEGAVVKQPEVVALRITTRPVLRKCGMAAAASTSRLPLSLAPRLARCYATAALPNIFAGPSSRVNGSVLALSLFMQLSSVASFDGAIGNTPLVRIKSISEQTGCEILGKGAHALT